MTQQEIPSPPKKEVPSSLTFVGRIRDNIGTLGKKFIGKLLHELNKPSETLQLINEIQEAQRHAKVVVFHETATELESIGNPESLQVIEEALAQQSDVLEMEYVAKPYEVVTDSLEAYKELMRLSIRLTFPDWKPQQIQHFIDDRVNHELQHAKPILRAGTAQILFGIRFIIQEKHMLSGDILSRQALEPFTSLTGNVTKTDLEQFLRGSDEMTLSAQDIAVRELIEK